MSSRNKRCSACAAVVPESEAECPVCGSSEFTAFEVKGRKAPSEPPQVPAPLAILMLILRKVVGSIVMSALLFAGLVVVVTALRGAPLESAIPFVVQNWWSCLVFGVFVTFFRLFQADFWRS